MAHSKLGNNAYTGVFLLGLGIIAWTDYWWPGIMFVLGTALLVSALVDGHLGESLVAIVVLLGIGVWGAMGPLHLHVGFPLWPLIFVVIGLFYLVKTFWKRGK